MRSFLSSILTVTCLVFSSQAAQADGVFKWKDARGNIQYGDEPPANVKVDNFKMPEIMVVDGFKEQWKSLEGDEPKAAVAKPILQQPVVNKAQTMIYTKLAFIAPKNNQVLGASFNGAVSTMLTIKPPLKKEHQIVLTLDGKNIPESRSRANNFSNLRRGVHTVLAKIVDRKGKIINQSEVISFRILRK